MRLKIQPVRNVWKRIWEQFQFWKGACTHLPPAPTTPLLLRTWCVALSKHNTHYDPRSRFSYLQSDNPPIETPHPLIRHPVTRWVFLWVWSPETFEPVPREYILFFRGTKTELLHKYLKVRPKFEVCTTGEKMRGGEVLIPVWKQKPSTHNLKFKNISWTFMRVAC